MTLRDAGAGILALLVAAAMAALTGASFVASLTAWLVVYGAGYVTGALLVAPTHTQKSASLAVIRTLSGLMLSAVAFLAALRCGLPWYTGPLLLLAGAAWFGGRDAFRWPEPSLRLSADGVAAAVLAAVVLAPPLIAACRMAPGPFPPVFFNVDVPYFLDKIHALVATDTFPPPSLSVAGGGRSYHYGFHAVAAVISRASGVAPHHALFAMLLPLLLAGLVAASLALRDAVAPAVPRVLAVPLLLVSVPTLWYGFWLPVAPALGQAWAAQSLQPLTDVVRDWEMWGVTANVQNLGAHFVLLAALAALSRASVLGWRLTAFLIGAALLFKSPAGLALVAGFSLSQLARAAMSRSVKPLMPVLAVAAVAGVVYGAFWVLTPVPPDLRVRISPMFLIEHAQGHGGLAWLAWDLLWLLLPALVLLPAAGADRWRQALPLLFFAAGPLVVVNVLRLQDLREDYGISSMNVDDFRQVVLPVPVILHAMVLSLAGASWARLGAMKAVFATLVLVSTLPAVAQAGRYADVLLREPEHGHEFADNRALGEALAAVPVRGAMIVTNDLRYPADGFRRDNLQMQIPALFGHQAFAVNYMYEAYPFSPERRGLQQLLQTEEWTPEIEAAARAHRWTHLVVHKESRHPRAIPLPRVFENRQYAVYRFDAR